MVNSESMEYPHEKAHLIAYYWEYVKRFGKESLKTSWRDFGIAFLVAIISLWLAWGDRTLEQGVLLGVEATGVVFGAFAVLRFFHTSHTLFRERAHPEHGGIRYTPWGYGLWGASILIGLLVGFSYLAFHGWAPKPAIMTFNLPAPTPPTITNEHVVKPAARGANRNAENSEAHADTSKASTSKSTVAPAQAMPQVTQAPPPATFLDRVVQENRALTPDDRNRLSTQLYECDQFIRESRALGYKVDEEFGKLTNDRQSGALAKNVSDHIKVLRDLDKPAWGQYHELQRLQDKWQYFPDQTEYVLGDNPYNSGVGSLLNAIEGMANALTEWSKISNRDQKEILNIEAQQQTDSEKSSRQFFDWCAGATQRINQMRESLVPGGVVQPITPNTVAPAPGMFL